VVAGFEPLDPVFRYFAHREQVKHDKDHDQIGELLEDHPFALAQLANPAGIGIYGYQYEQNKGQKAHYDCKPVVHEPAHSIIDRVFLGELQGQVYEDQDDVGNGHKRPGQTERPAVRQELVKAREETRQRAQRQRKGQAVRGGYRRAFLGGEQSKWLRPDIVVPDEKEEKEQIDSRRDYPLLRLVREYVTSLRCFHSLAPIRRSNSSLEKDVLGHITGEPKIRPL